MGRPAHPWGHCLPTSCPWLVAGAPGGACSRVTEPSHLHDGSGDRPRRPEHPRQLPQITTPRLPRDPRCPRRPARQAQAHLPWPGSVAGSRLPDPGPPAGDLVSLSIDHAAASANWFSGNRFLANLPRVARWHGDRRPQFLMKPKPGLPPKVTGLGLGVRGWRRPARRRQACPGLCSCPGLTHTPPPKDRGWGQSPRGRPRATAGPPGAAERGRDSGDSRDRQEGICRDATGAECIRSGISWA